MTEDDTLENLTELCAYCGMECSNELEVGGFPTCSDACRDELEREVEEELEEDDEDEGDVGDAR